MFRVIVAGSRTFNDYEYMKAYLGKYVWTRSKRDTEIICGEAQGADFLGKQYAYENDVEVVSMPANWTYGKNAGFLRNEKMAKYASEPGHIGFLVAFWDGESVGTKHMIDMGIKYELEVHIVNYVTNSVKIIDGKA